MKRQAVLVLCLAGLLAATSGCGVVHTLVYEPFGPNSICDTSNCGDCGGAVEHPRAARAACGAGVGACDAGAVDCGGCGNCRACVPCGPLSLIFGLFCRETWCGGGCGERYWGDWYGDPPDCCDPCDQCGNYTGRGAATTEYLPQGEMMESPGGSGPESAGCATCGQSPRPAGPVARTAPGNPYGKSVYAPRMVSQTDRVVNPAQAEPTPHLARPRSANVAR